MCVFVSVCMCVFLCMCTLHVQCLKWPEEGIRSSCNWSNRRLGTELRPSARAYEPLPYLSRPCSNSFKHYRQVHNFKGILLSSSFNSFMNIPQAVPLDTVHLQMTWSTRDRKKMVSFSREA